MQERELQLQSIKEKLSNLKKTALQACASPQPQPTTSLASTKSNSLTHCTQNTQESVVKMTG